MNDTNDKLRESLDSTELELARVRKELLEKEGQLDEANNELAEVNERLESSRQQNDELQDLISPEGDHVASWRITLVNNLGLVITGLIVLAVVFAVIAFFYAPDGRGSGAGALIEQLADPGSARGLITFLVVMGTVVMGLLLLISSFRTVPGAAESFTRGKEIFTILVGILGTIVGFYFGVGPDENQDDNAGAETVVEQASIAGLPEQEPGKDGGVINDGGVE